MNPRVSMDEERQLLATVEMFKTLTKSQPFDYQSLEILAEACKKLGKVEEELYALKGLVAAFEGLKRISEAVDECAAALERFPDDHELKATIERLVAQE